MGHIGKFCQPLFEPMSLNWQESVAILSGIPAKEIVVSTMSVLYTQPGDETSEDEESLSPSVKERLQESMSLPSAVAFLIFTLLYLPCVATIMAIGSELNWRWAVGSAAYNTAVAWIMAYVAYLVTQLLV